LDPGSHDETWEGCEPGSPKLGHRMRPGKAGCRNPLEQPHGSGLSSRFVLSHLLSHLILLLTPRRTHSTIRPPDTHGLCERVGALRGEGGEDLQGGATKDQAHRKVRPRARQARTQVHRRLRMPQVRNRPGTRPQEAREAQQPPHHIHVWHGPLRYQRPRR
jgi:hypothetical protein